MDIQELIDSGDLVDSDSSIACPNCDAEASLYCHQYDTELTASVCGFCKNLEWVNDVGSKNNPLRCPECSEFVTDEDRKDGKSVQCSAFGSDGESSCDQLAHKKCIDYCLECGWFCHLEDGKYLICDSCDFKHLNDHFVSFGKDFTSEFGQICQSCFFDKEDLEESIDQALIGTADESEVKVEAKLQLVGSTVQLSVEPEVFVRNREDQAAYLSHFVKKRDGMTEDDCFEQLEKILSEKKLEAKPTGYFSTFNQIQEKTACSRAVCFTEGRLSALADHSRAYSPFGVSFSKFNLLKYKKAAPAVYIHDDIIKIIRADIPNLLVPYVNTIRAGGYNFQHEREWRVSEDLFFELSEIRCIFAPKRFHNRLRSILGDESQIVCLESFTRL